MADLYEPHMKFGVRSPAIDMNRCRVKTYDSVSRNFAQCARRKVVEVDGIGYCKQHSPEETQKRADAMAARRAAEQGKLDRRYVRPNEYRDALREIAAGHNDPRALASEILEKWNDR